MAPDIWLVGLGLVVGMAIGLWVALRPREVWRRFGGSEIGDGWGRSGVERFRAFGIATTAVCGLTLLVMLAAAVVMSTR